MKKNEWKKSIRNYDFSTINSRVMSVALGSCSSPLYGLIRKNALETYKWYGPVHGFDRAILTHLICRGRFVVTEKVFLAIIQLVKQKLLEVEQ